MLDGVVSSSPTVGNLGGLLWYILLTKIFFGMKPGEILTDIRVCIDCKKSDSVQYFICFNCKKDICFSCFRKPVHFTCPFGGHIEFRNRLTSINRCCRCQHCTSKRSTFFYVRSWCRYQQFCSTCKNNFDVDSLVDR